MSIEIEGTRYKAVENFGFNHTLGKYGKLVKTPDGERVAVKPPGGVWKFHAPEIRVVGPIVGQTDG